MAADYSCSSRPEERNQSLGFLLCLLVIVYIFYVHNTLKTKERNQALDDQMENAIDTTPVPAQLPPPKNAASLAAFKTPYDRGYYDGMKAYVHFDIADLHRTKETIAKQASESKRQEAKMRKMLEEFEKGCRQMEKAMREEYLEALWEARRKGEKGLFAGWLKFGATKPVSATIPQEPECRYDEKGGRC